MSTMGNQSLDEPFETGGASPRTGSEHLRSDEENSVAEYWKHGFRMGEVPQPHVPHGDEEAGGRVAP